MSGSCIRRAKCANVGLYDSVMLWCLVNMILYLFNKSIRRIMVYVTKLILFTLSCLFSTAEYLPSPNFELNIAM